MLTDKKVLFTPLNIISNYNGDIKHGMKKSDDGFQGFGEAYFSYVKYGSVKGWKKHHEMVLNLIVVVGKIKFYVYDEVTKKKLVFTICCNENYGRLTIPAGLWVAFEGLDLGDNLLLNIASIEHDPEEAETRDIDFIALWEQ
ncbi:dTDP-4-dehydrorhamnose 3,5-epimerase [Vibrio lentus]